MLLAVLIEDLGAGDVTTRTIIPEDQWGRAEIVARQTLRVAGMNIAFRVFQLLSSSVHGTFLAHDGEDVNKDDILLEVKGPLDALLIGERVALNFLQHLCGVATITRKFVDTVEGTGIRILDTRKTLPGLRNLEKYAVRVGGGVNHRSTLSEGVLIKENHILAAGGISNAVQQVRKNLPQLLQIEVEASNLEEVAEALKAGADVILLDNMSLEMIGEAVKNVGGAVPLEVSGNVNLDNVRSIAETGVGAISIGRLTHSAPCVDLSMLVRDTWTKT